ncbi:hypothetical protein DMB92_04805 [Campylobacter sp. MIT 99-7217]|uniref:hypothetical protein n=1 Tax=Campylobacter sp. MIT 99-7217 TaxID=535091 RepID=UPI001159E679|nr:hypothetical protein [Campylobacter sp. MIT 99-7217]TQR32419.1 hypothetical protein DMB92_04805 [Campylobacter sp. MIT 99-7217]
MENSLIIFENTLLNCKEKAGLIIEDLTYNLISKSSSNIAVNALLIEFLGVLKKLDLLNQENATKVIKAIIKSKINSDQNTLYQYLEERSLLQSKIDQQKNLIKNKISKNFYELKNNLEKSEFKDEVTNGINEAFLYEVEALGILKETAESAFITMLEKGEDIELMSSEISKHLIYGAIFEGNFEKERILKSSQIILNTAFELANEYLSYSKALCKGVVRGVQEGIELGIEKFKKSFAYCLLEEDLSLKEKELVGIEDEYILLLKTCVQKQVNPAKDILQDMLENELDTLFAKLKRLASESREQLVLAINDLKKNPKIDDFSKLTQNKINVFKKEITDLEKVVSEKYKDFNLSEAKQLGINLWQRAKNLIKK